MNAEEFFPSKWLTKDDVMPHQPVTLRLESIGADTFRREDGTEDYLPTLHFQKTKKAMVCNKTNWQSLRDVLGNETDTWKGASVVLSTFRWPNGKTGIVIQQVSLPSAEDQAAVVQEQLDKEPPSGDEPPPIEDDSIPF